MTILLPSIENLKKTTVIPIYKEYLSLFQSEGVDIFPDDLNKIVNSSFKNAIDNYNKLNLSKIYYLPAYVTFWIREELTILLITKTSRKISQQNDISAENEDLNVIKKFFLISPHGSFSSLEHRLFSAGSLENRKKVYRQYQPLLKKLNKPFEDLVVWRNEFANKKGFPDYTSYIKKKDQIPDNEYELFVKNIDRTITYCYGQLPKVKNLTNWFYSRYNQPCFLCLVPFPKDLNNENILNITVGLYPQLKPFLQKIIIVYDGNTKTRYLKEEDLFKISINKNVNRRHQLIGFIHELGHVINYIDGFTKDIDILKNGKYTDEKTALEIQFNIIEKIGPLLLKAHFADLLQGIHKSLFQLAIYNNPKQKYKFLYARLFKKCFPCSSQRSNPLYLINEGIVERPLSSLVYSVASVKLLSDLFKIDKE